jgi:dihydropteroate synthase
MLWKTRSHTFDLSECALIMGVVNVTPDSFSDGGRWTDVGAAVHHGMAMLKAGADILDIGGESSRPGAAPVSAEEEIRRILPVITALERETSACLSVDTYKPEVALEALRAGAHIVNDIGGLRLPRMREAVRCTGAGAVAMHMQGAPATMQRAPFYTDVLGEVRGHLAESLELCVRDGINPSQIAIDPGIGFGKTVRHNLDLLKGISKVADLGRPVLLGVSRKSFLSSLSGSESLEDRLWPTVALTVYARMCGVSILRVHDVPANVEALRVSENLLKACA